MWPAWSSGKAGMVSMTLVWFLQKLWSVDTVLCLVTLSLTMTEWNIKMAPVDMPVLLRPSRASLSPPFLLLSVFSFLFFFLLFFIIYRWTWTDTYSCLQWHAFQNKGTETRGGGGSTNNHSLSLSLLRKLLREFSRLFVLGKPPTENASPVQYAQPRYFILAVLLLF